MECVGILEKFDMILDRLDALEKSGKTRKKRAPSAYNVFIGSCMKHGKDMKECAIEYKKDKEVL